MPSRQNLIGLWLLLTGLCLVAGLGVLIWLEGALQPSPETRPLLWCLGLAPTVLSLLVGWQLERRLFRPLRQFQVLLARLVASPDAQGDYPVDGWLQPLQPDLDHIREGWRQDRVKIREAHAEGAREAEKIKQELEALLQVLDLPLLICDRHQRLLLFNPAAAEMFHDQPGLGLGRPLSQLLPHPSLADAIRHLPDDGTPHQLLLPGEHHWLRCQLRRLGAYHGGALITLQDTTAALEHDQRWRRTLAQLLPKLRGHCGSLNSATEALLQVEDNPTFKQRLESAIEQESQALATQVEQLTHLVEAQQLSQSALEETWSNDLCSALKAQLLQHQIRLTPIGIPAWMKVDGPALLALLQLLVRQLSSLQRIDEVELEVLLGNRRVYVDLSWDGIPLSEQQLQQWRSLPLFDEPLSPRVEDVLDQHGADLWSIPPQQPGEGPRLRLPLPASGRGIQPLQRLSPRPEFHDFSIADLPAPSGDLASLPLQQLEMVVFDTETTGLDLRRGDRIISLAACRILNGRLLADDVFDQRVNPQRAIPPESTAIHGLKDEDVAQSPPIEVVLPRFRHYVGDGVLVAHNAVFDLLALQLSESGDQSRFTMPVLDTLLLSRAIDPSLEGHGLDALAERFDLSFPPGTRHTALGDARVTAELLLLLLPRLANRGVRTLGDALELQRQIEQEQHR
ncbi:3'-5' exonuclease [Marinobacterium sediminicola]|uniref:DNA-directed DNA polymerase n=1 Tax=Marinobacterium sediminicola TaxID=518898 RepID=A0ABY1RWC6_9GAMM|nr:exonuclease domain-containing protein [Marinobacterium sediminicola]ULG70384.1 PAS domain-containing protein [Marinobacterium sediminicola]SMR69532.1 DNA polymerase-3 subunit epsilon [Marinobacterium sediminicola]